MMKNRILNTKGFQTLIVILLLSAGIIFPQSSKKLIDLNGRWKFSIGDNANWMKTGFNDKSWESIKVPSSWEDQGFHGYDGIAWYRKSVVIPSGFKGKSLSLDLGRIDDVDQVYFNGELIGISGSFPPDYSTAYNAWRKYTIPENLIRFGSENLISVRVYDAELSGGILEGDCGIYEILNWDLNLSGLWKFSIGDNPKWKEANYNDQNWRSIVVPGYWEYQGEEDYDGYAWYRLKFYVPDRLKGKELILVAGKIDDFDQAFINGRLIGSTGPINDIPYWMHNRVEWQLLRAYKIPTGILKFGEMNTIAIRVYDGFVDGGIYEGPVSILTKENYSKFNRGRKQEEPEGFWGKWLKNLFGN